MTNNCCGPFKYGRPGTAVNPKQQCFVDCCNMCPPEDCCDVVDVHFKCGSKNEEFECDCTYEGINFHGILLKKKNNLPPIPIFNLSQESISSSSSAQPDTYCICAYWNFGESGEFDNIEDLTDNNYYLRSSYWNSFTNSFTDPWPSTQGLIYNARYAQNTNNGIVLYADTGFYTPKPDCFVLQKGNSIWGWFKIFNNEPTGAPHHIVEGPGYSVDIFIEPNSPNKGRINEIRIYFIGPSNQSPGTSGSYIIYFYNQDWANSIGASSSICDTVSTFNVLDCKPLSPTLDANNWTFLALTCDLATNTYTARVNSQTISKSGTLSMPSSSQIFGLGTATAGYNNLIFDEWAVAKGVLTSTDLDYWYNGGAGRTLSESEETCFDLMCSIPCSDTVLTMTTSGCCLYILNDKIYAVGTGTLTFKLSEEYIEGCGDIVLTIKTKILTQDGLVLKTEGGTTLIAKETITKKYVLTEDRLFRLKTEDGSLIIIDRTLEIQDGDQITISVDPTEEECCTCCKTKTECDPNNPMWMLKEKNNKKTLYLNKNKFIKVLNTLRRQKIMKKSRRIQSR